VKNLFFDTVLGNEAIGNHLLILTDTMARAMLAIRGRIPPGIYDEYIVGLCKIDPTPLLLVK
jgi:hypothetical protein